MACINPRGNESGVSAAVACDGSNTRVYIIIISSDGRNYILVDQIIYNRDENNTIALAYRI